jgi:hypothetical protein
MTTRTRHLGEGEQQKATKLLLSFIRSKLISLSRSDPDLLFAYRRKIYKELIYDERGKPMYRRKLKQEKWGEQKGKCAVCRRAMPLKDSEMDRIKPMKRYTLKNIRVVHHDCHRQLQEKLRFV